MEAKKTKMLSLRLTDEERALLERMAKKKKLSLSSYVRMVLTEGLTYVIEMRNEVADSDMKHIIENLKSLEYTPVILTGQFEMIEVKQEAAEE